MMKNKSTAKIIIELKKQPLMELCLVNKYLDAILANDKAQREEIKRLNELVEYLNKQLSSPLVFQKNENEGGE